MKEKTDGTECIGELIADAINNQLFKRQLKVVTFCRFCSIAYLMSENTARISVRNDNKEL